jgi:transposase
LVFDNQETRWGYHAKTFLQDFKGYLQTDAYRGYAWAKETKTIIWLKCMAHARRPFAELSKLSATQGVAHDALKFFQKLYAIKKTAREQSLSFELRYALRQQKALPILITFKEWL